MLLEFQYRSYKNIHINRARDLRRRIPLLNSNHPTHSARGNNRNTYTKPAKAYTVAVPRLSRERYEIMM